MCNILQWQVLNSDFRQSRMQNVWCKRKYLKDIVAPMKINKWKTNIWKANRENQGGQELELIQNCNKKFRKKLDRVSILRDTETARVGFFTDKPDLIR